MDRRIKKSGLLSYLHSLPSLDWNSEDSIASAKKLYYKAYKNAWRRQQRKVAKQFIILLSASEAKIIADAAKVHKVSRTRFIKQACFAYLLKRYLPTEPIVLAIIRQLLGQNLIELQQLKNRDMLPADRGIEAINLMNRLERAVLNALYNPKEI